MGVSNLHPTAAAPCDLFITTRLLTGMSRGVLAGESRNPFKATAGCDLRRYKHRLKVASEREKVASAPEGGGQLVCYIWDHRSIQSSKSNYGRKKKKKTK